VTSKVDSRGADGSVAAPRPSLTRPSQLPPGPTAGRLGGTVAFHRDPLRFLRSAQRIFGDVFTIRLATTGPVVVIAGSDAAEELAELDSGAAGSGAHAGQARKGMLPMASSRSVFGADAERHRVARARSYPAFSAEAVAELERSIATIVDRHIDRWPRGRPTRLLPRMRALADEIFVVEILGIRDTTRAGRLVESIQRLMRTPGNPPLTIPAPHQGLLGRGVEAIYRRRRAPIAELIEEEIAERGEKGESGPGLLGLLLNDELASEDDFVEELLAMLMAAQEPMASALAWLALSLGSTPRVVTRLRDEGPAGDYERAVIEESLRLHPPAVGMLRELTAPARLAGLDIPAGTTAMAPIPLLQRDRRMFADPDRFVPERHLADGTFRRPGTWPFGRGPRSCIAEALARTQLAVMARAIGKRVTIDPLGAQPERMVLRATILVPQRSGLVRVSRSSKLSEH
jgi:cytochrome P450